MKERIAKLQKINEKARVRGSGLGSDSDWATRINVCAMPPRTRFISGNK
jgi:hypothetical protein